MLTEVQNVINHNNDRSEVMQLKSLQANQITASVLRERRHAEFFEIINSSLRINCPEDFLVWAQSDLKKIFPHEVLICCLGIINSNFTQVDQLLTYNLPSEYLQTVFKNGGIENSPTFCEWNRTRRPVLFDDTRNVESKWTESFERHCLMNMAAFGQCDLKNSTASYFCFAKIPDSLTSRHSYLLEMLVPHLHVALNRAYINSNSEKLIDKPKSSNLSVRELEILKWIRIGKTNWEIAQVLGLSEYTVKNHVQKILQKLGVNTRSQALIHLNSFKFSME